MSQFLGMVHHMMYNKIIKREERIKRILSSLSQGRKEEIEQKMDEKGIFEEGPLEEIIDLSNIHSWLNERVILSEERLGVFLEEVSKDMDKEELLHQFETLGKEEDFTGGPKDVYMWMVQNILDGMPCDQGLIPLEESPNSFQFQIHRDLHAPYLPSNVMDLYWDCRGAFLEGLLEKSNLQWKNVGSNIFEIR